MRTFLVLVGLGIFLGVALFANLSRAELICIHPVPLTIKELVDKQKAGLISEEVLQSNSEYLTFRYCAVVKENLTAVSSVPLGDGCEMRWGNRLGELVYWSTCDTSITDQAAIALRETNKQIDIDKRPHPRAKKSRVKADIKLSDITPEYCRQYWPNGVKASWTTGIGIWSGGPKGAANMKIIMRACGRAPE